MMWPMDLWVPHNIIFWSAIVMIVAVVSYFKYRTRVSRHRLLEKLAEKGHAITPEVIDRIKNAE